MKLNDKTRKDDPIVSMIEHEYNGRKHIFVATTRSVYVVIPKEDGEPPYLKPIPFEVIEE